MANRDENIKKINDELEKLDDEQLEKVAGGARYYPTSISCITPNTDTDSNPFITKDIISFGK